MPRFAEAQAAEVLGSGLLMPVYKRPFSLDGFPKPVSQQAAHFLLSDLTHRIRPLLGR